MHLDLNLPNIGRNITKISRCEYFEIALLARFWQSETGLNTLEGFLLIVLKQIFCIIFSGHLRSLDQFWGIVEVEFCSTRG